MKRYSVVILKEHNIPLLDHLLRSDGQEDLCFATYIQSTGDERFSAILTSLILPEEDERIVHGNVGFLPHYFERVLRIASERNEGVAFLHSHPYPGWQGMSTDDIVAESRIAPAVYATTQMPLVGLTLGSDGAWSGRFWCKDSNQRRKYDRNWCETVRVVGKDLKITFNDYLLPPCFDSNKQLRTISAWGKSAQEDLSRLRVGIVGLGSVGSMVAEILARTGISNFTLIDFDSVEEKNLDRLTNVYPTDIGKAKVAVIKKAIERSSTSPKTSIDCCEFSICEPEGFKKALNCDVLFSCVDRPWPRQVLNLISYAHLIPVVDGGILVRTNKQNTRLIGADWKVQTVGYTRVCLECLGQYKTENAALEKSGMYDDPDYIKGLDKSYFSNAHENVFVFSSHIASMEVLQLLSIFLAPSEISDVGQQMYHFVNGRMDVNENLECHPNCYFQTIVGKGDQTPVELHSPQKTADEQRRLRNKNTKRRKK